MEVVLFEVNKQKFGMNIDYLVGIEDLDSVTMVASAPAHISGITNVRGEIVPVFDLCTKFAMEKSNTEKKYLLVRLDNAAVCIAVDEVIGMKNFEDRDIFDVPGVINQDINFFSTVLRLEGNELSLMIDPNTLISNEEQKSISEFVSELE